MKRLVTVSAFALAALSCAPSSSAQATALGPLVCDAGFVAYNFSRFPTGRSLEDVNRALTTEQSVQFAAALVLAPNVLRISSATCDATNVETWTELVRESCEGKKSCVFQRTDCRGSTGPYYQGDIRIEYTCSATPNARQAYVCGQPLDRCIFDVSCPQPSTAFDGGSPLDVVECVPETCNVGTRRDARLRCVPDLARPTEYSWGYNAALRTGESAIVSIRASDISAVYPSVAKRTFQGAVQLDLDTSTVDYFNYPGASAFASRYRLQSEAQLPNNRILLAETLYKVKATVSYPVNPGTANEGMHGALALWVYDEYEVGGQTEKAFRCLMHSVDMTKYGRGTRVDATSNLHAIQIDETFVVPKDCRENSAMFFESQGILSRAHGWTPVEFANRAKHKRAIWAASYDLEGQSILLDEFGDGAKKITCAPNPVDFFFNGAANTHDRYAYYAQRQIRLNFQANPEGPPSAIGPIQARLGNQAIFVLEANYTTLGISGLRPKFIEQKVRTAGPARGFLRVDADWYLSGDRHKFWQLEGFKHFGYPTLKTWLVPLDANGNPVPEPVPGTVYRFLGAQPLKTTTPYGETFSARYPVTSELRELLLQPGGVFEAGKAGKRFKFKSCIELRGTLPLTTVNYYQTLQYAVELSEADRCRLTDAPVLIRADPAITPLEPISNEDLAESNPANTGDGRMSQNQENDQDRSCAVLDGGVRVCRTSGAAEGEGSGAFGGSALATQNDGFSEGTSRVHVDREIELGGFEVLDDPEEQPYSTPETKIEFRISPDWDSIAEALKRTIPGARATATNYSEGVKGISLGLEVKVPIRYGPVQAKIVYSIGAGVGVGVVFEYTLKLGLETNCANEDCDVAYRVLPADTLPNVANSCYGLGGRLADLTTDAEAAMLRANIGPVESVWLGAQVAEDYALPACSQAWWNGCQAGHVSTLRWLNDDEDFAVSRSGGAFSFDGGTGADAVFLPGVAFAGDQLSALSFQSAPLSRPLPRGVTLTADGVLEPRLFLEPHRGVCKLRNSASAEGHEVRATLEVAAAATASIAVCTPDDELGVCLEGSFNLIEAKLKPSVAYIHYDLEDRAGRKGVQSKIELSLDYEVRLLSGAVDVKVVLGPWFSFTYNLFTFNGLTLPLGGNITKKEFSLREDFQ